MAPLLRLNVVCADARKNGPKDQNDTSTPFLSRDFDIIESQEGAEQGEEGEERNIDDGVDADGSDPLSHCCRLDRAPFKKDRWWLVALIGDRDGHGCDCDSSNCDCACDRGMARRWGKPGTGG